MLLLLLWPLWPPQTHYQHSTLAGRCGRSLLWFSSSTRLVRTGLAVEADDLDLSLALVQPLVLLNLLRQHSLRSCRSISFWTAFARGQIVEGCAVLAPTFGWHLAFVLPLALASTGLAALGLLG